MLEVHLKMCKRILGDKKRAVISGSDQKRKFHHSKVPKLLRKQIVRHRAKKFKLELSLFSRQLNHTFLMSRAERGTFSSKTV